MSSRQQLRPFYSEAEHARIYDHDYDHTRWGDHLERVAVTAGLVAGAMRRYRLDTVADLSCGDGQIVMQAQRMNFTGQTFLGDLRPGFPYTGPIEKTLDEIPQVDLFVCSETLEHVEDPDTLLARIRGSARFLVLSTPDGETGTDNPEHYWGWDRDAIREMLETAGWEPLTLLTLNAPPSYYTFQIWLARHS